MSRLKDSHLRGGAWAAASAAALAVLTFANFLVLSRLLSPEIYGLVAMATAALALGRTLLPIHAAEALVQLRRLKTAHVDSLFWTLQALGLAGTGAVILLSPLAGRFFPDEGVGVLVAAGAVTLYLHATAAIPRSLLTRRLRFGQIAKADLSAEAAGGAVGIALAWAGFGAWSLIALQIAVRVVELAVLWRMSAWRPHWRWSAFHVRELLSFGVNRTAVGWVRFLDEQLPRFLLGRVHGAAELGGFFFARRLVDACETLLVSPIQAVGMPAFARLQDNAAAVRHAYESGSRLTASLVFPAFAGVALLAPVFVPLLFGERWTGAVFLVQLLALRGYRRAFSTWNSAVLRGLGKPQWLLISVGFQTLAAAALMILLLGKGAEGAAWALLVASYLSWPLGAWLVARLTGLAPHAQARLGVPAVAATAAMAAAVIGARQWHVLAETSWASLAVLAIIALSAYTGSLAVFGRADLRRVQAFLTRLCRLQNSQRSAS